MKRFAAAVLCALLMIPAASAQVSGPPELSAQCAILMDGESGRVLFQKNAHRQCPIASITKLMTALVALEYGIPLDEQITIRPEWTGIEGSSIYLRPGEIVTLEILLYGLLMQSGNDAAVAVAAHCAGSVDAFVERMNERAIELGMQQSCFADPSGLSDAGHYSTAYDMALLAQACCRNETLAKIVATRSVTLGSRTFTNHNKLLWRYDGCTGMKTGYTKAAGRTLVSSAGRNGQTLLAVTLNAPNDWADHMALFDFGFENYPRQMLCRAGKAVGRIPVTGSLVPLTSAVTAQDVYYPLAPWETVRAEWTVPAQTEAPLQSGDVMGELSFYLDGQKIGRTELLAKDSVRQESVPERSLPKRIKDWLEPT